MGLGDSDEPPGSAPLLRSPLRPRLMSDSMEGGWQEHMAGDKARQHLLNRCCMNLVGCIGALDERIVPSVFMEISHTFGINGDTADASRLRYRPAVPALQCPVRLARSPPALTALSFSACHPFVRSPLRPFAPSSLRPFAPSPLRPFAPSPLRPFSPFEGATPSDLGMLTFCRGVAQSLAALPGGVYGNRYDRVKIMGWSAIFWGAAMVGVGVSTTWRQVSSPDAMRTR
jgi:hypothetical protein